MKFGATCGTIPNRTRSSHVAPEARRPSSGRMSAFSTTSKYILPKAPIVWTETAMMAAIGPSENIARKKPAMTISGNARSSSMNRRTPNRSQRLAVRFRAARKHRAKPNVKPMSVDSSAMFSVSAIL